jgi:nitrate/TMAO reductase-like tetraheme cytochrome c subunit
MKIRVFSLIMISILFSCATKQIKQVIDLPKTESLEKAEEISAVSEEDLKQGKATFEGRCTSCHQLYEPKEFDKNEWKSITHRMQKKAHLDDIEIAKVYNYIVSNLK